MRILFIFALSMFLISCQEETISGFRQCGRMTISDALPVQFWLTECETYNEHEPEGVFYRCWCQPWECDDEILIQFLYDSQILENVSLFVKDSNGEYILEEEIDEVLDGVWQKSFIPEDNDICDEQIQLLIGRNNSVLRLEAPSGWSDAGAPATAFDSKSATTFGETITSADGVIGAYMGTVAIPAGTSISFTATVVVNGTWTNNFSIEFLLSDFSGASVSGVENSQGTPFITANGTYEITYTITTTAEAVRLDLRVIENLLSGTANLSITIPVDQIIYIPAETIYAKSDCLDIKEDQPETVLIEYSNQRNFDGLVYENQSPDISFNIRVPGRFYHETEPEEDEAIELTSSTIITSSQVKTQRLFEIKHGPYYWHKKLRRVLKHQSLTIFDKSWKKEEKYDLQDGNMKWPLKSAKCLLTETNSVVRNVM